MNNEIAFYSKDDAFKVCGILIDNGYVCMLSREEELWILNYLEGRYISLNHRVESDRNEVVFMNREDFNMNYVQYSPDSE